MDGLYLPAGEAPVRTAGGSIGMIIETPLEDEMIARWERKNFTNEEKIRANNFRRLAERPINVKMYVDKINEAGLTSRPPKSDELTTASEVGPKAYRYCEGQFRKQTVRQRKTYVQVPVVIDEQTFEGLSPAQMQDIFNKPKSTLLICGEGGAGKTSLACQLAFWAMSDESGKRLCKNHPMLPVLIEGNLEPQQYSQNVFTEAIRGHLREGIGTPDAIPEQFLLQLLRKCRVLVIVDSLSELDGLTRRSIRPVSADFPVAALVVTSRFEDDLGSASKTTLRPLRLRSDRLSAFMDGYLKQRGKRDVYR